MAKRTTNLWSWRWPGKLRAAILSLGFVAAWGPEQLARADDVVRSNATVLLEYRETDYNINNWGVYFRNQTAPFKREPAAVSGKVFRGVLDFGGVSTNSIPFLWQRDARKLVSGPEPQPGFDRRFRRSVYGAHGGFSFIPDVHQCPSALQHRGRPVPGAGGPQSL